MKAVQYEEFGGPLSVIDAPEPVLPPHGAIIGVRAAGMCRSDWHGWQQNDPDILPPQIPGHEWAGVVVRVGDNVGRWRGGERVTAHRSSVAAGHVSGAPREINRSVNGRRSRVSRTAALSRSD